MNVREILEQLSSGELSVEQAESHLAIAGISALEGFAQLDTGRHARKGVPEVIYATGKTTSQLTEICGIMLEHTGRAIVSALDRERLAALEDSFGPKLAVASREAGMAVIREPGREPKPTGGRLGILTAGTSDIPVAEQARIVAEEMGCEVVAAYDVGVAGVHRLRQPLEQMIGSRIAALVVAAGMEGALPSVVAGLVPVPVIGLPTSTGYGLGGKGVTALLSMLQSCSPGLVVVNIDNGIGAGATAALIANRSSA